MANIFTDDFTGTSGTELNAYSSSWTRHSGTTGGQLQISDANRVRRTAASGTNQVVYYHSATPSSADYSVTGVLFAKTANGNTVSNSVVGRVSTSQVTFYQAGYYNSNFRLGKRVNDVGTELGTYLDTFNDETSKTVKLVMEGDQISLYVDDVLRIGPVTDTSITAAGKAGIRIAIGSTADSDTAGLHLDSISADDNSGGSSGKPAYYYSQS